jgi:hypothetical protein
MCVLHVKTQDGFRNTQTHCLLVTSPISNNGGDSIFRRTLNNTRRSQLLAHLPCIIAVFRLCNLRAGQSQLFRQIRHSVSSNILPNEFITSVGFYRVINTE